MQVSDETAALPIPSTPIDSALNWGGVLLLFLMAALQIFPPDYGSRAAVCSGVVAIIIASGGAASLFLKRASTASCSGVMLVGLLLSYYVFAGPAYVWPLHLLLPLAVTFVLVWKADPARISLYLSRGKFNRVGMAWMATAAIVVASTLLVWLRLFKPDLSSAMALLPHSPGLLVVTGFGFSLGNAILEEVVWRSVLLQWLARKFSSPIAVAIQAMSFGAAHWNGFPSGLVGAILASIFGAGLGLAALRSRGLLAVTATHAIVDAIIFTILTSSMA